MKRSAGWRTKANRWISFTRCSAKKKRLNASNASRVEFITTVRYIERYLRSSDRILDIGAGTYSFYFARKGYSVSTLEVAAANAQKFCENRCEVAADGASELMQAKINALNEVDFQLCIRYHAYICEKKECIGTTNHLLFVCENDQERSRVL